MPYLGAIRDALHGKAGLSLLAMLVLGGYAISQVLEVVRDKRKPVADAAPEPRPDRRRPRASPRGDSHRKCLRHTAQRRRQGMGRGPASARGGDVHGAPGSRAVGPPGDGQRSPAVRPGVAPDPGGHRSRSPSSWTQSMPRSGTRSRSARTGTSIMWRDRQVLVMAGAASAAALAFGTFAGTGTTYAAYSDFAVISSEVSAGVWGPVTPSDSSLRASCNIKENQFDNYQIVPLTNNDDDIRLGTTNRLSLPSMVTTGSLATPEAEQRPRLHARRSRRRLPRRRQRSGRHRRWSRSRYLYRRSVGDLHQLRG